MKLILVRENVDRVLNDLLIPHVDPTESIKVVEQPGSEYRGVFYSPECRIELFVGLREQGADKLRFATAEINRTLLHEIRHWWQYLNWHPDNYADTSKIEPDAERFAWENCHKYRCVRLVRPHVRNGFTKLAGAESRVRAA